MLVKSNFNVKERCVQLRSILVFVVFFQTPKDGVDVAFIHLLAGVHANFFTKFFVVACAEAAYGRTVDALKFTTWVIVIKNIVGWVLLIFANTVSAFYNVDPVAFAIVQGVDI